LRLRYARTGNLTDLQKAIELHQQAVGHLPAGSPDRAGYWSNLGNALSERYLRAGDLADLWQAIVAWQQAVDLAPIDAPDRGLWLNNLGKGLLARYTRTGNMADLNQAIEKFQEATQRIPPDSPDRASLLNNLGSALNDRHTSLGNQADLDDAIEAYQQAVSLMPLNSPDRAVVLSSLGTGLRDRYVRTGDLADLSQAITACQQAVELMPEGSPNRAGCLTNLGTGLHDRYARTGDPADLQQAIKAYQEACNLGLRIHVESALITSRVWGKWSLERQEWEEATEAFGYGIQAIEQLTAVQLSRSGKEAWLREAQPLPASAAYAYARCEQFTQAVIAIENGRARLLAEALERHRADLERLKTSGHTQEYEWYQDTASRVARLDSDEIRQENLDLVAEQRAARTELDAAIAAIRRVPGYKEFFQPPAFAQIQRHLVPNIEGNLAAAYFLVTSVGGLALLVHASGVKQVWFDLTEDEVNGWLLKRDGERVIGGYLSVFSTSWTS
jgi:hypothetical protein